MKELQDKKCVSAKGQFEYAWCLIRSKYGADIQNGIKMFETLCIDNPDDKRDYIYYLAIAYCRIKDYTTSQKYVKAFLEIEPNNQQVLLLDVRISDMDSLFHTYCSCHLQEYIEKELSKEFKKDAAIAGGALLVFGGLLGLGFALAKK